MLLPISSAKDLSRCAFKSLSGQQPYSSPGAWHYLRFPILAGKGKKLNLDFQFDPSLAVVLHRCFLKAPAEWCSGEKGPFPVQRRNLIFRRLLRGQESTSATTDADIGINYVPLSSPSLMASTGPGVGAGATQAMQASGDSKGDLFAPPLCC